MPHKDPAIKRAYMRVYYRKHREEKRAKIKAAKKAMFARDPEHTREKWRQYRKAGRARAALRELEAIRAQAQPRSEPGYTGRLNLTGR